MPAFLNKISNSMKTAFESLMKNYMLIEFRHDNHSSHGTGIIIRQKRGKLFVLSCLHNIFSSTEQVGFIRPTGTPNSEFQGTCGQKSYGLKAIYEGEESSTIWGADIALFYCKE